MLQEASKAYHSQVNDLLLTALAFALNDWNGDTANYITLEGHGRENINETIDHSRTVGWFTSMYPVKLEVQETLSSTIKQIKETLHHIPNKGLGFGALYPKELCQLPPISFNYLGQFDSRDDYWQVVGKGAGMGMHFDNEDKNIININGMVVGGQLSFSVVTALGEDVTQQMAMALKTSLETVISHCQEVLQQGIAYHTPSDFETVTVSQTLIDRLNQQKDNPLQYIYPANSLQQGFIYHALSQTEDDAYRVQQVFDYKQELNPTLYIKAWELAIQRFPILRTAFNWDEELLQVIYQNAQLDYQ